MMTVTMAYVARLVIAFLPAFKAFCTRKIPGMVCSVLLHDRDHVIGATQLCLPDRGTLCTKCKAAENLEYV